MIPAPQVPDWESQPGILPGKLRQIPKVSKSSSTLLESTFRNPPFSSGVYTWWHWMNGNITKDGITCDLEAMKANGIAGYQLFEAGSGLSLIHIYIPTAT